MRGREERPPLAGNDRYCPAAMKDIIACCWHQQPNRRPSARKVLQLLSAIEGQDKMDKEEKEKEKDI